MTVPAGALRQARNEVAPNVFDLAPRIEAEPLIILDALQAAVAAQQVDPASIGRKHWNKTERHTIFSGLINRQREILTEGEGEDCRFRDFVPVGAPPVAPEQGPRFRLYQPYRSSIIDTIGRSVLAIEDQYGRGDTPETSWLTALDKRVRKLGSRAMLYSLFSFDSIPPDGISLYNALNNEALADTLIFHADMIMRSMPQAMKRDRVRAAHNLLHLSLPMAGMSPVAFGMVVSRKPPKLEISRQPGNTFTSQTDPESRGWNVYRRKRSSLVRLKCPATSPAFDSDKLADADEPAQNLRLLMHAGINALAENTDFFEGRIRVQDTDFYNAKEGRKYDRRVLLSSPLELIHVLAGKR